MGTQPTDTPDNSRCQNASTRPHGAGGGYRLLWRTARCTRRSRRLLPLAALGMVLVTLASQLEIFALGVLTKKGPAFFELFAPIHNGRLTPTTTVTYDQLELRWRQLDSDGNGIVDEAKVNTFLSEFRGGDFLSDTLRWAGRWIDLESAVWRLAVFILLVALFKASTLFMHRYATRLAAIEIAAALRYNYFAHIQSLPMAFYQKHDTASLSSRVASDTALVAEATNSLLANALQTPFTVLTTLVLCFLTSWQLSLVIFIGLPLIAVPIVLLARRVKRLSRQIQEQQGGLTSALLDFIIGIGTVKAFGMEGYLLERYGTQNRTIADLERRSARYDLSTRPLVHTVAMLFLATTLLCGLYLLHMDVSELFFFCGLLYLFYEPIKRFAEENSHIQRGISAAERMGDVMQIAPDIDEEAGVPLTPIRKEIVFRDVWFRYDEEGPWVLRGVNFSIAAGEAVAFVGATGAGKSTAAQLFLRFYDTSRGEIVIDGRPIRSYRLRSLRDQVSWVAQRPFLFADTVAGNIACCQEQDEALVTSAAERAHASEFIERLPAGYNTLLAEGGKTLSGGQQQRLTIARALYRRSSLLILDEATSALDALSEQQIREAVRALRGEVTQILIAHRLSILGEVDRIVYFDQGQAIAQGTLNELLEGCAGFRLLWEAGQGRSAP